MNHDHTEIRIKTHGGGQYRITVEKDEGEMSQENEVLEDWDDEYGEGE